MDGQTDNTVAVVAVVTTGVVGLLGPMIAGMFGRRRQDAELKHQRELDEVAERRRVLTDAVQGLLTFRGVLADMTALHGEEGRVSVPPDYNERVDAMVTTRRMLEFWFGADTDVDVAYQACVDAIAVHSMERWNSGRQKDEPESDREGKLRVNIDKAFSRFFETARPYLQVRPE